MTIVIAHRGDPLGHPENTLEAFASAEQLGAGMVELDCKLTRDGHVVVLHDRTLARLWGVRRAVRDLDLAQVTAVRRGGYRVPELAEVLVAVPLGVLVDVPSVAVAEAALLVARAEAALSRCVFCGSIPALVRLRQLEPGARIALTWDRPGLPDRAMLELTKPEWWNPRWQFASTASVEAAHTLGLGVSVWTVDRASDLRRALARGVDAIITNRTARAISLAAEATSQANREGGAAPWRRRIFWRG
ncbi:MAG TPA: glycerophosphodiester phosphodiesterase [Acidimicrobiales bacterium]|nr:glycerophosphodiester phosphodiesterase [Acidimicrobiales bacterium]